MTDNFSNDENALFKAQIREQDLAANQKLQEIQGAADELARQAIINKLRQAEIEREKLQLELEQEASGGVNDILSYVELRAEESEDYFADNEMVLESIWQLFKPLFGYFKVDADFGAYRVIKEKEEKENLLARIISAFKKLIKAIFSRDSKLSWHEGIDKKIEELYERLLGGGLSGEERAAILQEIDNLQQAKFHIQIFLVGCAIIVSARLLSAELTASVETTKEEGKEKTSAKEKEAAKEVHEIIEIKVNAEGRYQIVVPSYLLDFSSGVARPITLTKPELDLLPKPLTNLVQRVQEYVTSKENSGVPKQEVKEKQGQENKKATQPAQKPVAAPKAPEKVPGVNGITFGSRDKGKSAGRSRNVSGSVNSVNGKGTTSNNKRSTTSSFNKEESESTGRYETDDFGTKLGEKVIKRNAQRECAEASGRHETDDLGAKLAAKVAEKNARKKCAEASTKHNYPIDHFQVPAGTNGKSHVSAKNEPQPKSECSSVKINNHVESIGKAQEEVSSRSM